MEFTFGCYILPALQRNLRGFREGKEDDSVLSGFSLALDLIPDTAACIIHIDILRPAMCLGYAEQPIIASPFPVFVEHWASFWDPFLLIVST